MGAIVDHSATHPEEWAEARRYALVNEWSEENDAYLATAPDLPAVATDGRFGAIATSQGGTLATLAARVVGESERKRLRRPVRRMAS